MAQNVYGIIKADGTQIVGDSTVTSMDREDTWECFEFHVSVDTPRDRATGMSQGQATAGPVRVLKAIDQGSPLTQQALFTNQVIEAEFHFFRPAPLGDGTTEQHYSITFYNGRISGIEQVSPNSLDPAAASEPDQEWIEMVYGHMRWEYKGDPGASEYEYNWREQA